MRRKECIPGARVVLAKDYRLTGVVEKYSNRTGIVTVKLDSGETVLIAPVMLKKRKVAPFEAYANFFTGVDEKPIVGPLHTTLSEAMRAKNQELHRDLSLQYRATLKVCEVSSK